MHKHFSLIAIACLLVAGQAFAIDPKGFEVTHTGHLVELCSVTPDDPYYRPAMGFCMGYLDAAIDYHQAITAGGRHEPIACPSHEVTRHELVTVFLEWSKNNAPLMTAETPVHGVIRAAAAKWPCPAG